MISIRDGNMKKGLRKWLASKVKEIVGAICITMIATGLFFFILDNWSTFTEWFDTEVTVWVAVLCIACVIAISVSVVFLHGKMKSGRSGQTGILWQEHHSLLFRVELQRNDSRLDIISVAGPYCRDCMSRVDVLEHVTTSGHTIHVVFCPNCEDAVADASNSEEVLVNIAKSIVEGRINRGELTRRHKSIEW